MSAGITVYNTLGKLVVNETYINFVKKRKINIADCAYDANALEHYQLVLTIPLNDNEIFCCVGRDADKDLWLHCLYEDPAIDTGYKKRQVKVWVDSYEGVTWDEVTTKMSDLYIYTFGAPEASEVSSQTVGMQIFSKNGSLVFDTNREYMRILYAGDGSVSTTIPTGHKAAIGAYCDVFDIDHKYYTTYMARVQNGVIDKYVYKYNMGSGVKYAEYYGSMFLMIAIDVTNY